MSIVPVGNNSDDIRLKLEKKLTVTSFPDWSERKNLLLDLNVAIGRSDFFITNSTLYKARDNFRYVYAANGTFDISQIASFPELEFIIEFCKTKRHKQEIYSSLRNKYKLSKISVDSLLAQLYDYQILWSDITPNITGQDYFNRLNADDPSKNIPRYYITERKHYSGFSSVKPLNELPELINFLNARLPYYPNNDLEHFKKAFINKYDRQFLPLTWALDPEFGVGYARLETGQTNEERDFFNEVFHAINNKLNRIDFRYNQFLLDVIGQVATKKLICLEGFKGQSENEIPFVPNSISVLYHTFEDKAVLHSVGGCTANSLLGRFTLCGSEFEDMGNALSSIEQLANPDVAFFDVSYQAENHVDNINRRKQLYSYELPLFTWSTSGEPLSLRDIYVGVRDSTIEVV